MEYYSAIKRNKIAISNSMMESQKSLWNERSFVQKKKKKKKKSTHCKILSCKTLENANEPIVIKLSGPGTGQEGLMARSQWDIETLWGWLICLLR